MTLPGVDALGPLRQLGEFQADLATALAFDVADDPTEDRAQLAPAARRPLELLDLRVTALLLEQDLADTRVALAQLDGPRCAPP